ncbi:D-alanyl-D-alanine carboxypeptidase/D-alanyl-D-alanine endopeptidase [Roseateles terrae]|uniref:D-alanyl-D-alanine carboxypeptidase/D-alanyl-D-alanine-endopeptidase (Penicillin-binding protein 4) n=1 Tax=Roseateles terrae TaxID=431060 RepID=A0ABR6GRU7_9BURK|nr:D-alanyl-D-alanine carboxypeptidase/D-alanyl-D-alanine-endopeptidase [Roseateles terrae]MBB3194840.1 D-alanyl-D-alanine carboxypeptidase/D-alanyl-D-alanine-endopeptidase (penicillin-binding protein 4) [Roseateles terrae]OWQ85894.1 D-alanyl-D-alanine carboxypeptidase/D-alanyl-D-alanine-endopeptidase [Roseateles terrae]
MQVLSTPLRLAILSALALSGCATGPERLRPGELPAPVAAVHARSGVPLDALAVMAYPLNQPSGGLRLNADRPMQGASTMKLLTAAAALDRLGPNSRGRTELLVDGDPTAAPLLPAPDGHLRTPLYLKGGADADLDWSALWLMLRELRERQGISALDGGVVVDRTMFRPARPELGAPDFDEQPEFPYNVIPDALNLNGSLLSFDLQSDAQQVQVRPFPLFGGLEVDTQQLQLADGACKDWDDRWQIPQFQPLPALPTAAVPFPAQVPTHAGPVNGDTPPASARLTLRGTFPRDCQVRQSLNVLDRQWTTAQAVRQLWTSLGGSLSGEVREGQAPAQARVLVRHQDRPLAELLRPVLKASDNATTRLIFQRLGAAAALPGEDTLPAAQRAVKEWLMTQGVDPGDVVLENGAGLSRVERISPAKMAAMLASVHRGRHGPELMATLPVAGADGTLSRRFKGTPAEGRARMKTGTLRDVVALAGYVPDASGQLWVVVAVINDERAAAARPTLDALVSWVAAQ